MGKADRRLRFRLAPLLLVLALGLGLPILGAIIADTLSRVLPVPRALGPTLPWLYWQHLWQTLLALVAIFAIKRMRPFDAGLRLPSGPTYFGPAILWGVFFGALMTVVDYWPDLVVRHPMDLGFPVTRLNVFGWLVFEGIYVGPTEEILFRSLLVGYFIAAMPGTIRFGRYEMSWAGVIVAAIFALAHIGTFITRPSFAAFGQQIYAFALGVLYAYWFEKSKSVAAPIVGHNVSDVTEYAICFALIALWR